MPPSCAAKIAANGQVQRRTVQVEAVSGRQDEAHDALWHAEPLHDFERLRQRRFAARGREGDEKRLADRTEELQERHTAHHRRAADDEDDEDQQAGIHRQDQLAERHQDAEALAADRRGNRRHHADGREAHHVAGELEHRLRDAVQKRHDRRGPLADSGQGDAEERGEHHDLQDVALRHRVDDRRRHHVQQDVPAGLLLARHCRQRRGVGRHGQRDTGARLHDVHQHEADDERDRRRQLEPDDRLEPDAAHGPQIAGAGDADNQCREQQRRDDHLDHAQEEIGERLDRDAERRVQPADENADGQADEDLRRQAGKAARRGRSRSDWSATPCARRPPRRAPRQPT